MSQIGVADTFFFCPPIGCNQVLDGTPSAQNGLETDGANEEYTLMSVDTIISGKVIIASYLMTLDFLAILAMWLIGWKCQSVGQSNTGRDWNISTTTGMDHLEIT